VNKQELENRLIEFAATIIIVANKFEKLCWESSWANN
jgi:hypothetical protein